MAEGDASYAMRQRQLWLIPKIGITAVLLYFLAARIDGDKLIQLLGQATPGYLLAALALQFSAFILGSVRWWLLIRATDPEIAFRPLVPSYFLGLFANNFLPTGVGGDAVRTAHLHHLGYRLHALVSSALIDRLIGLIAILVLGGTAFQFSGIFSLDTDGRWGVMIALLAMVFPVALLFTPATGRWLDDLSQRHHSGRIGRFLVETALLVHQYRSHGLLLANALAMTLVLQCLVIGAYIMLALGTGLDLPVAIFFSLIPIVVLASNLPISLGGLGVREGVLVALLVMVGVDEQHAISLSLLYLFINWIATLPGGYVAFNLRRQRT
jgi:glycosyltransferase 2 family protein